MNFQIKDKKAYLIIAAIIAVIIAGAIFYLATAKEEIKPRPDVIYEPAQSEYEKLVKYEDGKIYYMAGNGERYVFPNEGTLRSWFTKTKEIKEASLEELYEIPLGGNVFYRPGSRILQTPSDFNYYYVNLNGVLNPFGSEKVIEEIYGSNWKYNVDEIENYYFTNYKIGQEINSASEIPKIPEEITIDQNNF